MLRLLLAVTVLVAIVALACDGGDDDAEQTPEPTKGPSATQALPTTDGPLPTNDSGTLPPGVQGVVDAIHSGDPNAVGELIEYEALACVQPQPRLGGPPPCRDGEAVGTTVTAIRISTCETQYVREDGIESVIAGLHESSTYAVYTAVGGFYDYVMLLSRPLDHRETPEMAVEVRLLDGRITHVNFTCVLSPEEALMGIPEERILVGPLP